MAFMMEGRTALLSADMEASAPPIFEMAEPNPSAPVFAIPAVLSEAELQALLQRLPAGAGGSPSPDALRTFRVATAGRLLWTQQMRVLAARAQGGPELLREAYERHLLLDPESLTLADGPWVPPPLAPQAFREQLTVLRFDGKVANLSADFATTTIAEVLSQAAGLLGEPAFTPGAHQVFGVGSPVNSDPQIGHYVRITGLVAEEHLNGAVGPVLSVQESLVEVGLQGGVRQLHRENVVPYDTRAVVRNPAFQLDLSRTLAAIGVPPGSRLLWLEDVLPPTAGANSPARQAEGTGQLNAIRNQLAAMGAKGQSACVSVGEMRNFLWNLRLSDEDFAKVRERFAPDGSPYISLEEMLFLLGRPHLQSPDVPIDALIYEAVVSILGRRATAHIDRDLGQQDRGVGRGQACRDHCASYTTSIVLQAIILFNLGVLLLSELFNGRQRLDPNTAKTLGFSALGAYVIYLCHLLCCVRLTRAFANKTTGMEQVLHLMNTPRGEHPHFRWTVQCYHYETRTETNRDSDGNTKTETRTERVNTHFATHSGIIPSVDLTPEFIPSNLAAQTQIDTHLDLDLSQSNYVSEYHKFCAFNRWDLHQDCSRTEDLPSRASSCMAVLSQRNMPCWMNGLCYWLANIFLLSFFFRWAAQSRMGHQHFTYVKKCYPISTGLYSGPGAGFAAGMAVAAGAVAVGAAVGAAMGAGPRRF